jgi:hypothetical protein
MASQSAQGECCPGSKAEDRYYDSIAALSSIPSISQVWSFPTDDSEFQEVSVCARLLHLSSAAE